MSTWRTRTTNKMLAAICLVLLLLAAFPVCAFAFDGIVTPKGAARRARPDSVSQQSGGREENLREENAENAEDPDDAGNTKAADTSGAAVSSDGEENSGSGSSTRTAAGAAVLVGAGAYTYMRGRWKEKDKEQDNANLSGEKYVHFENHTKSGIEKAEKNAIGNAERTEAKM